MKKPKTASPGKNKAKTKRTRLKPHGGQRPTLAFFAALRAVAAFGRAKG